MSAKIEKRNFELRAESQGDEFALAGYAAKFENLSNDLGGFCEVIDRHAFDRSLASGANVKFTFNHSMNDILARTDTGTLKLAADGVGLRFYAKLNPKIQRHVDLYEACKAGLYRECSFAFTVPEGGDQVQRTAQGVVRRLLDVNLLDASLVGDPAYPNTSAAARNAVPADNAVLLAKLEAMPELWQRQERAAAYAKQIARDENYPAPYGHREEDYPAPYSYREIENFLAPRWGKSRAGHASRFAVLSLAEISSMEDGSQVGTAICMDMNAPMPMRVKIRFVIDPEGDVTFSDPEEE